ncbi:hypothetical protein Tco_0623340 [Tanacetum coccineum]
MRRLELDVASLKFHHFKGICNLLLKAVYVEGRNPDRMYTICLAVTSNWAVCCALNPPVLPPILPEGNMPGQQSMEGETGDKASSSTSSKQHSLVWKCFERIEVETPSDRKASCNYCGNAIVTQQQNSRNALLAEGVIEPTLVMLKNCSCEGHEEHQIAKGIPIHSLNQVLKEIISGANGPSLVINGVRRPMPLLRILEIELYPTLLYEARSFGLSNNWIQALVEKDPVRCQVLHVQGCLAGSKAKNLLQQFDMIQDTALVLHTQSIGDGVLYNILIEQQNLGLNGISEYVGTTKYGRRTEDEAS